MMVTWEQVTKRNAKATSKMRGLRHFVAFVDQVSQAAFVAEVLDTRSHPSARVFYGTFGSAEDARATAERVMVSGP